MKINSHYTDLSTHYLFHDIDLRVKEYLAHHPDEHLLRMGVGDVTRPLPRVIVEAMCSAAEELAHEDTFRGYGPENGYEWLQQCKDLGLKINIWTIDDPEIMQYYIDKKVDFITTNEPELCKSLCK